MSTTKAATKGKDKPGKAAKLAAATKPGAAKGKGNDSKDGKGARVTKRPGGLPFARAGTVPGMFAAGPAQRTNDEATPKADKSVRKSLIPTRPARAEDPAAPVEMWVKFEDIIIETTQTRAAINMQVVEEYAEAIKDGADMPKVDFFSVDGKPPFYAAGGVHRTLGRKQAGYKDILAIVHRGDMYDAIMFGAADNNTHGLRRTNEDKARTVQMYLRAMKAKGLNLSNREVERACGVDHKTVAKYRDELDGTGAAGAGAEGTGETPQLPETRTGRDGKERKMPEAKRAEPRYKVGDLVRSTKSGLTGKVRVAYPRQGAKGQALYGMEGEHCSFNADESDLEPWSGQKTVAAAEPMGAGAGIYVAGRPGQELGRLEGMGDDDGASVGGGEVDLMAKATAGAEVGYAARLQAARTADEARTILSELDSAVEAAQRALGLKPVNGQVETNYNVGFECVARTAWDKVIKAAMQVGANQGLALAALIEDGLAAQQVWNHRYLKGELDDLDGEDEGDERAAPGALDEATINECVRRALTTARGGAWPCGDDLDLVTATEDELLMHVSVLLSDEGGCEVPGRDIEVSFGLDVNDEAYVSVEGPAGELRHIYGVELAQRMREVIGAAGEQAPLGKIGEFEKFKLHFGDMNEQLRILSAIVLEGDDARRAAGWLCQMLTAIEAAVNRLEGEE